MKRISLLCTILVALGMAFVSCNDSNGDNENGVSATGTGTLVINLKPSTTVPGATRASTGTDPSENDEAVINSYEVFVFSQDAVNSSRSSATPIAYRQANNGSASTIQNVPAIDVDIVVVTNYDGTIGGSVSYETLIDLMSTRPYNTTSPGETTGNASVSYTSGFEMTGEKASVAISENASNQVTVEVIRIVSKHNEPNILASTLTYSAGATDISELNELFGLTTEIKEDNVTDVTFTATGYALINGRENSKLFYNGAGPSTGFTYWNSTFDGNGAYENNYTATGFLTAGDDTSIYAFENTPTTVNNDDDIMVGYDPLTVYAFIIEGTLSYSAGNPSSVTRYWRINLGKTTGTGANLTEDDYKIFRNGSYYLTVNNVYSVGYETPEEAENQDEYVPLEDPTTVTITLEVLEWDLYETETDM